MASLNKVFLIGNLGADPEKRFTGSGTAVVNLRLATSARWTDKSGQKQERTEWHRVVVYGPQAEACAQYLSKGRPVFVEGEVRYRQYEDKTGATKYITEIIAQRVQFLGSAPGAGTSSRPAANTDDVSFPPIAEETATPQIQEEDIPF